MKNFAPHSIKTNVVFTFLLTFCSLLAFGQVTNSLIAPGTYKFESDLPSQDLHFYLFDNGYHSFDKLPENQYNTSQVGANPVVYTALAYDPDPPFKLTAGGTINNGIPNTDIENQIMSNKVQIKRSWNLMEDEDNYFILMFENTQSDNPISGCVEFHFSDQHSDVDPSKILDNYNDWVYAKTEGDSPYSANGMTDKITWNFDDLEFGEQRYIYIPTGNLQIKNSNVLVAGVMNVGCESPNPPFPGGDFGGNGGNGNQSIYVLKSMVKAYPHDPNCIVSTCPEVFTGNNTLNVEYRVYFQNEGDGPAIHVDIESRFPNSNIQSVELLQASHACTLAATVNGGVATLGADVYVSFENINLPGEGMGVPYEMTIGWVDFKVCFNYVDLASCIQHQAGIEFFTQAPMYVENDICDSVPKGCNEIKNATMDCNIVPPYQVFNPNTIGNGHRVINDSEEFKLYPNPSSDRITVELPVWFELGKTSIEIYSAQGKLVKQIDKLDESATENIDVYDLLPGLYLIRLSNDKTSLVKSFVRS